MVVGGHRAWLDRLLSDPRQVPNEERIVSRFRKHRPHLLTFLPEPGVAPTSNLAERQLRPAAIARKLPCGSRTEAAKPTFETLASFLAHPPTLPLSAPGAQLTLPPPHNAEQKRVCRPHLRAPRLFRNLRETQ